MGGVHILLTFSEIVFVVTCSVVLPDLGRTR